MASKLRVGLRPTQGPVFEAALLLCSAGLAIFVLLTSLRAANAEKQAMLIGRKVQSGQQTSKEQAANEVIVPHGTFGETYRSGSGGDGTERPAQIIGELRIPALELAVPIISGITNADLRRGVGHVQGTGYAGGLGNMALAGHRDTFLRPLRRVAPAMLVLVTSSSGSYRYQVDRTQVVSPEQLEILDIGDRPQLTLITCYPFNYIGAAPSRFIVFAHLVSAASDEVKK